MTVTVLPVHPDDAKLILPLAFLTVTVKEALDAPTTIFELGVTWICPPLLDVAVIVPEPVAFVRLTFMVPEPLLTTLNGSGLAFNTQGAGVGVAVAVAVGVGLGYAVGVGLGYAVGVGLGYAVGVGLGVGYAVGVGDGVGLVVGVGDGEAPGFGLGSGT